MGLLNRARIALGIMYLLGAIVNLWFTLFNPRVYQKFADFAIIPFYRTLWSSTVMPYLTWWLILVVIFEITAGVLILSKGSFVKIGLTGCIIFNLFLIPFWWSGGSLINVMLLLVQVLLLKEEYDSNVIELLYSKRK